MDGMLNNFFSLFTTGPAYEMLRIVGMLWFVWLPLVLLFILWDVWVIYLRTRWTERTPWTLLEIKLPREIAKSPRAMEIVLTSLHSTRQGNLFERFWDGYLTMWYSLEIVSIQGEVHFFVYTPSYFRNLVESQLYSQYPNIEIVEVDDYTKAVPRDLPSDDWRIWAAEFGLTKPDVYPIKTYMDFKLDDGLEEEEKADPLSSLIEFFGSIRPGEQLWFQILIRGSRDDWQKKGEALMEKLLGRKKFLPAEEGRFFFASPGESDVLKAIDRNISKLGYKTGMRFVYLARKDVYSFATFASFLGIMKQFSSMNLNGFAPVYSTSVDYFFSDMRSIKRQRRMLRDFRKRSYFFPPYGSFLNENSGRVPPFVLNTEELATIFHLPGLTSETPTFKRLDARKGGPPPNLPI